MPSARDHVASSSATASSPASAASPSSAPTSTDLIRQPTPVPVLVVGEALIDVVVAPDGTTTEHVGGSPANVAKGLARLEHPVELATHIGVGPRALEIMSQLSDDDVTITSGSQSALGTSTATATLDDSGAATYSFDLEWELPAQVQYPAGGHLHTGSIAATLQPGGTGVADLAKATAAGDCTVSYDPNARPAIMGDPADARETVEALIALSDVVKASDEDVAWLLDGLAPEEAVRRWLAMGPSLVVVTRGGDGAVVGIGSELRSVQAGNAVVVDTVGAGDSFMAGLISGLLDLGFLGGDDARARLRTATMEQVLPAIERALACAAITVSRAGANPPRRAELR